MAITQGTLLKMRGVLGRFSIYLGYANDGATATTVEVNTKLRLCYLLVPFAKGNGVQANALSVDEDFTSGPLDGSAITVDKDSAANFYWIAIGLP
jgi:hypothetical protein